MRHIGFLYNKDEHDGAAKVCKMSGLQIEGIFMYFASIDGEKEIRIIPLNNTIDLWKLSDT